MKDVKQYFIADTHFGHDKFHSDNWKYKFWKKYNAINTPFILYHLGDLSFIHNHEFLEEVMSKFRANKNLISFILILGNHDDKASRYLKHNIVAVDSLQITYNGKKIILTHEPINISEDIINIHGHLHTLEESHRDNILKENNYLIEAEKIYEINEILNR